MSREKKLFLIFAMIFFILSFTIQSFGVTIDWIIEQVQTRYEKMDSFQARFVQETWMKSIDQMQYAEGKVYFKKQGMMLWDYQSPSPQSIICNENVIWMYYPNDKQAFKNAISKDYVIKTPILFLFGKGSIRDEFKVDFAKLEKEIAKDKNYFLELIPLKPQSTFSRLVLGVNKENFQINKTVIYDLYGNITTITFDNININKELSNSIFQFEVPSGVKIIETPSW